MLRVDSDRLDSLRTRVRIAYVLIAVTYMVVCLTILLSCQPMSMFWQISPNPGSKSSPTGVVPRPHEARRLTSHPTDLCQPTISKAYVFVVLIPNIVTDCYLLSIPLPASLSFRPPPELGSASNRPQLLWSVQIGIRQKASLILLFSGAVFIMVAGTIRAVVILEVRWASGGFLPFPRAPAPARTLADTHACTQSGPDGAVQGSAWACRENFVALIVTNLPVIQPLIRRCAQRVGLSGLFSRTQPTDGGRSVPLGSKSHSQAFRLGSKNKTAKSSLTTYNQQTSAWASDEHILGPADEAGGSPKQRNIVVNQEIRVTTEPDTSSDPASHGRSESRSQWD